MEGNGWGLNLRYYPGICLDAEKNHNHICEDSTQPVYLKYLLILSSYLCTDNPGSLFGWCFLARLMYAFLI
jgi:hypothetical protein